MTRPDTAYGRPYLTTAVDGNGQLTASVGNPYLKPATAWQFDATAEYYFSRVGSITANIFVKDVKNFFYQSTVDLPITNNGVTFPFATRGPANYDGHGKIKGFELAYQQTFDFLPGLLSGFGVSGNYSYIKSSGLRSEEHTSELQSLMRISYAVFRLKKKNKIILLKKVHTIE